MRVILTHTQHINGFYTEKYTEIFSCQINLLTIIVCYVVYLCVSLYQQKENNTTTTNKLRVMKAIIEKIEKAIETVINGGRSEYIKFDHEEDSWTVRVSNHGANPQRTTDNFISLVVDTPESEDEDYTNWCINKKSFREVENQFYLNENGDFTENFYDIAEMLDYILN